MHFWFNSVLTQDSWFYICFGRSGRLASDFWDDFESIPEDKKELVPAPASPVAGAGTAKGGYQPQGLAPGQGLAQGFAQGGDVPLHNHNHPLHSIQHAVMQHLHISSIPLFTRRPQQQQLQPLVLTNMLALGPSPGGGVLTGLRNYKPVVQGQGQGPGINNNKSNSQQQENSRSRRAFVPPTTTQKG